MMVELHLFIVLSSILAISEGGCNYCNVSTNDIDKINFYRNVTSLFYAPFRSMSTEDNITILALL